MAWTYLIIAGLLEIVWAYFMKQSAGFTRFWPSDPCSFRVRARSRRSPENE